jgi:hypothetical protein
VQVAAPEVEAEALARLDRDAHANRKLTPPAAVATKT